MYCKTRLVYPADLRFLIEQDERRHEERPDGKTEAQAAGRSLFALPREATEERKYSAWSGEDAEGASPSKKDASDRLREDAEEDSPSKKNASDRLREDAEGDSSSKKNASDRLREDAEGDSPSKKNASDRLREDAEEASSSKKKSSSDRVGENAEGTSFSKKGFSNRLYEIMGILDEEEPSDQPHEGTPSTEKDFSERADENAEDDSRARDTAAEDAASQNGASQRSRERMREEAPSGKGRFDRKRESAGAGTTGRWSLFDRAREETKVARPGFVEKAEASARARAAEERDRPNRRRDSVEDPSSRRRASEEAVLPNRRRDSAEDQPSRRRASEETERPNRRRDSAEDLSSRGRASEKDERPNRRRDSAEDPSSRRRASEEAERLNRRRDSAEDLSSRRRASEEAERSERRRAPEKTNGARRRSSGNPVVRLPGQPSGSGIVRPVVRLPEKKGARAGAEAFEGEARPERVESWRRAGEETLKKARGLTKSAGKAFQRVGSALEAQVRRGRARLSGRAKPVRTAAAKRENAMRGPMASQRFSGAQGRRQPPRRVPPRGARNARANVRSRQGRETFLERHLRSLIAMVLLAVTVIVFCVWCTSTTAGKRTFAQLGIGSASGYILLGDDCMEAGNYARAVEHYYRALSRHTTYESAIKLARAYQMTGDTEREASVLLLCADQFETEREPYDRLKALYPTLTERPETVQNALNRGAHVLGDASIAQ